MSTQSPRAAWLRAYEQAHQAVSHGYHVFPIGRGKLPAIRSPHRDDLPDTPSCRGECGRIGHGVHDATADLKRLDELFDAAPYATGYGIACGRGNEPLLGVDLDRKNGVDGVASLAALAEQHGFNVPETTVIGTPSGGEHRWFTGPAGAPVRNSAGKLGPGIDVRGYGGYLVGPGSWTPKGVYRFAERRPAAELPDGLLALMLPPPPSRPRPVLLPGPRRGAALVGLVKFVLEAPEGQLNNRLYWSACRAYETGADPVSVSRALVAAAVSLGHPERAAERTVTSARNAPTRTSA
ncbi:bifunctional DNA primase/polymerase [Streptomyces sp. ME08-AFT2]|uniref:bifunctional DNA primase/polymerase n=1 Tax=Streptomyces sp. ME08-AFT2 TaxID=3028683 RepID=UPI0029A4F403|nr:bifunctional DNA primase/polymerase [Streptomyces sp. ME08-AFT2]MDX3314567.1 bifunctional DNA primase/polymerase [Streptomyces sp. ME08-AFT2]